MKNEKEKASSLPLLRSLIVIETLINHNAFLREDLLPFARSDRVLEHRFGLRDHRMV